MINALESKSFRIEKTNEEYGCKDVKISIANLKNTGFCCSINNVDELIILLQQAKDMMYVQKN